MQGKGVVALKKYGILCMLIAVCLSGCGKSAPPAGETVRGYYNALESAQMKVKILSDFGQSALEYRVNYEYNKEDNDLLTVTEPESISGVKVEIAGQHAGNFTIQYEDAALEFGRDAVEGLTPVDVVADLMYDLCTGDPTEVGTDTIGGVQTVSLHYQTMDVEPEIAKTIWIAPDTMKPVCAELYCAGEKRLTLFFEQFEQS